MGLNRRLNDILLSLIELLTIRSGHAYRYSHLHHHSQFPKDDDFEGSVSKQSAFAALKIGVFFQARIWLWALKSDKANRFWIFLEGIGCVTIIASACSFYRTIPALTIYVLLMIMGSWIIPFVTSYLPHNPKGETVLLQTKLFRGVGFSIVALNHLYHLEHHLYPAVPHQNWPILAQKLNPYFQKAGLKPLKLWF
jgi:beta-carotene hydroxylase